MEPTLKEGDRLTAYYPYSNRNPERQDIVLFDYHGEKRVSRIIGLPGDTIEIRDGMVYVNDTRLEEPYLASGTRTQSATARFHVPADSYFVMGDNRGQSNDSRAIGPILQAQIFGKVVQ